MLVGVATRQYAPSLEPLGPEMQSRGTSKSAVAAVRREDAAQLAAWQSAAARRARSRRAADRRRPRRRSLPHRRAGDRSGRAETRAGPVGWIDGECDRLPGPARQSPESRSSHRSQSARDPRWLEGAAQGGARDVRGRRAGPALSSPQDSQHPRVSQRTPATVGAARSCDAPTRPPT